MDVVIPYVDTAKPRWRELCDEYRIKEGLGPLGGAYARDYGTLKYLLRSIEKNLSGAERVFLVVQDEDQVPDWIKNVEVVYHRDYIPTEFLPTFNPHLIEAFYPFIENLGNNYLNVDDDMFFINWVEPERYFRGGLPVMPNLTIDGRSYLEGYGPGFGVNLDNGLLIERTYGEPNKIYFPPHFPAPHVKRFDSMTLFKNLEYIKASFSMSRFSHPGNIAVLEMMANVVKRCGKYYADNTCINGWFYTQISETTDFRRFEDARVVCFNDLDEIENFELVKKNFTDFLERKFPDPSRYEK